MTASAAEMRRVPPLGLRGLVPWRSRLARRMLAAHVAMAAVIVLATVVMGQLPEPWRSVGIAAVALAAALVTRRHIAQQLADPVAKLAAAVEAGGEGRRDRNRMSDLATRSDEIGRLAAGLQRPAEAPLDRIAANQDFAADVAHEIRNPLASLRSAADALRRADAGQREKLLAIIEQDVGRLDRLVGEISSASRLDAELVRETATEFDLLTMVGTVTAHLSHGATAKGVEITPDLPEGPIAIVGLEARLAQVVVNVVSNAISLCEEGDAIRVWVRRRGERVLLVVEDTGPGIPDGAAEKIFRRFYSCRPGDQFGENSGLGLAISRQIVEAHDGSIWAENIRPTESDLLSEPLGARFVVVLPL